jgi:hypothetical protein
MQRGGRAGVSPVRVLSLPKTLPEGDGVASNPVQSQIPDAGRAFTEHGDARSECDPALPRFPRPGDIRDRADGGKIVSQATGPSSDSGDLGSVTVKDLEGSHT